MLFFWLSCTFPKTYNRCKLRTYYQVYFSIIWQATIEREQMTCNIKHVTFNIWHIADTIKVNFPTLINKILYTSNNGMGLSPTSKSFLTQMYMQATAPSEIPKYQTMDFVLTRWIDLSWKILWYFFLLVASSILVKIWVHIQCEKDGR